MTRVCVGKLIAGESRNVIPAHAVMEIETRGETGELDQYMVNHVCRIVNSAAEAFDVKARIETVGSAVNLETDHEISLRLQKLPNRLSQLIELPITTI